jgi:PD-(D/E)XK nuclease superfamily protein
MEGLMPIVGWYCPKCRCRVPLDHWAGGSCDAVHPDYAAAVLADNRKDRTPGIHVTSVVGCPRKAAMEGTAEVYIDPLVHNSIVGGTAWHGLMAASAVDPSLCEVEVTGTVGGAVLVGRVDRLHSPAAISDWKVTSEWAEKWLMKPKAEGGGMKGEHLAQLSLYAELVEQTFGWRPMTGTVWYRTHKTHLPFTERLWDLTTVLDFHPLGGEFSVSELIQQAASGVEWQQLPLAGESMAYGQKSACDYCSMREPCWAQAKGAPF